MNENTLMKCRATERVRSAHNFRGWHNGDTRMSSTHHAIAIRRKIIMLVNANAKNMWTYTSSDDKIGSKEAEKTDGDESRIGP